MNLNEYLSKALLSKAEFARRVGVSPAIVYQWSVGLRPIAPKHCSTIELVTEAMLTRQDLRPHDWQMFWPDLPAPKRRRVARKS